MPAPPSTNEFLMDRAFWHFTRGLALVARKDVEAAARESAELFRLSTSQPARALDKPHIPVTSMLKVLKRPHLRRLQLR